jgi:hypothetical protein
MTQLKASKEDVVDELRLLRKGEGFTPMRYVDLIVLPDLLGGRERDFYLAKIFFMEAIEALPARQWREALLVAFGLECGYAGFATVRERRAKYSRQVGRQYDTLRHWEDVALEQLAALLLKAQQYKSE